jgi:hypothetical protein
MAEDALDSQSEIERIDKKAEARSLTIATIGITFFPWIAIIGAVVLALAGYSTGAYLSGAAGLIILGPQVIAAIRRR